MYDSGALPLTVSGYRAHVAQLREGPRDAGRPVPWEWNWPSYEWQLEQLTRRGGHELIELDGLFVLVGEFSLDFTVQTSDSTDFLLHVHH